MLRRALWLLPIVLFACHAFLGSDVEPYQQGYDQAVRDVQRAREQLGWTSELGGSVPNVIEHLPRDTNRSEEWNEGYRQAVREVRDQFKSR